MVIYLQLLDQVVKMVYDTYMTVSCGLFVRCLPHAWCICAL